MPSTMSVSEAAPLLPPPDRQHEALALLRTYCHYDVALHQMGPAVTALVEPYGLRTTTEPRHPGKTLEDFRPEAALSRNLGQIATNIEGTAKTDHRLAPITQRGKLGSYLAQSLWEVTGVYGRDGQIIDKVYDTKGRLVDGTVVTETMTLTVPSSTAAERVCEALYLLLRSPNRVYIPRAHQNGKMHYVTIGWLNEHFVRGAERDLGEALIAKEDMKLESKLPPDKARYEEWLKRGETFLPVIDRRQRDLVRMFRELEDGNKIDATYVGYSFEPWRGKDIGGTCQAPVFQAMRSIMNGLIRNVFPTGSARNKEQSDDYPLSAEEGIKFMRQPFDPNTSNPPDPRALTAAEKRAIRHAAALEAAKANPTYSTLALLSKLPGLGISTLGEMAVSVAPSVSAAARLWTEDYKLWIERLDALDTSQAHLDSALRDLTAKQVLTYPESAQDPSKLPSIFIATM